MSYTAIYSMVKKVLTAATAAAVSLFSAPSFAGSIGQLTSTNTVTTTAGTRQVLIQGNYESEEHTVASSTTGRGATASASRFPLTLTTSGIGGATANSASATYNTNAVTKGTYKDNVQSSFSGIETVTMSGVFFNY